MIPKECKRLAEVDFPIAVVSKHAAKEKSIHYGHPSTLHLWWARRPLASSRAVLLALLLPDPCDEHCPAEFKAKAKLLLPQVGGGKGETDAKLREGLLKFIGDFANWDLSANATYIEIARALVKAAHPEDTPLVVDPFAGGGSIPLEALRLGCDAFASDLNPVASMIQKVMLEDMPRFGPSLADALRHNGAEIKKQAEKALSQFYPADSDGAIPIAYLWARTVRCEAPDCGSEIPLLRTIWLAKRYKKTTGQYTKLVSLEISGDRSTKSVSWQVKSYATPTRNLPDVSPPTITGGKPVCPCCNRAMTAKRVRELLTAQNGGTNVSLSASASYISGARLMAVILRRPGEKGVHYRVASNSDYVAVALAIKAAEQKLTEQGPDSFPNEVINPIRPSPNARGVSGATRIGITDFGRLFTARQKVALTVLSELISASKYDVVASRILSLALTKLSERSSSFVTWINSTEAPRGTFARQALTIAWDFIELVPAVGDEEFVELVEAMAEVSSYIANSTHRIGQVEQASATDVPLADESAAVWFTDPPYYDSVPYADLSDYFFVWLKRIKSSALSNQRFCDPGSTLTPKALECTWNQAHLVDGESKSPLFFEQTMGRAFAEGRRLLSSVGIGCVVFAHKSTEGWEALLTGMVRAGLVVVGSWPVATERGARLNAKDSAALATSIHLICRPRGVETVGDWGEVLRELPKRVTDWMQRLQAEHVRGADLVFACMGPALEVFSRYAKVETAEGREVPLAEYLEKVWEVVGRAALEQVLGGGAGALEEDARLTALFLWTLQSSNGVSAEASDDDEESDDDEDEVPKKKKTGGYSLVFDVARRFAQPLGIHLPEWEGRIIEIEKGVVRLLPVAERAKQLFGEDGTRTAAAAFERNAAAAMQMVLFPEDQAVVPEVKVRGRKKADGVSKEGTIVSAPARREATTLDRVHAAMLLQGSGQTNALRALLQAEQDRGPDFLRLANALSALYPRESEEKRLLDAMLLAVPR